MLIEWQYKQLIEKLEKEVEIMNYHIAQVMETTCQWFSTGTMDIIHPIGCSLFKIKKILEEYKGEPITAAHTPSTPEQLDKIKEILKDNKPVHELKSQRLIVNPPGCASLDELTKFIWGDE